MRVALVVDPTCQFASIDAALAAVGFLRDGSVRPVTPDVMAGETELAAWTGDGAARLTYTFNPVVSLRVVEGGPLAPATLRELRERLPLLDTDAVGRILADADADPRRLLLGCFAARVLGARELAGLIGGLRDHPNEHVRRASESVLATLGPDDETAARGDALTTLRVLCEQAVPVLAALVGPDGSAAVSALRPRADDYERVFRPIVADAVRAAYERSWASPPAVERLVAGEMQLRVDAAPAGMLAEPNELSRRFPGGYLKLAPYLQPNRIWFTWHYVRAGNAVGTRYDGVVRLDDRWIWFPKPYRVVGEILRS